MGKVVFEQTKMLTDVPFHYCPGCPHGIAHRLVAECIEEMGMQDKAIGVAPVGCAVFAYNYFNCDMMAVSYTHLEGYQEGRWIVMDYGDIIVHIFHKEERKFYDIERLWQDEDNFENYAGTPKTVIDM